MTLALVVLAHGGHNDGAGLWLLVPLLFVGGALFVARRRQDRSTDARQVPPKRRREGSRRGKT